MTIESPTPQTNRRAYIWDYFDPCNCCDSGPTPQTNRRAYIWRPGCKRLLPEKPVSSCNPATLQPDSQGNPFAFVSGIINRNPKKH